MRDYTYTATVDSIGEGWSDPDKAVELWNRYIAPVLADATTVEMFDNGDEPLVSTSPGRAGLASEWAWNEFCGREAGENEDIAIALAQELEHKLN